MLSQGFTASSENSSEYRAVLARFDLTCWMPATEDPNPWLMAQLSRTITIIGIDTDGATVNGNPFYTKTYTISYGTNGVDFTEYLENGEVKVSGLH